MIYGCLQMFFDSENGEKRGTDHFISDCIFLSTFGNASRVECHSVAVTIAFTYSETVFDLCNYKFKFKFIHINRVAPLELHINDK